MGIFSNIGSMFGPIGGFVGGAADQLLGSQSDESAANRGNEADDRSYKARAAYDWEKAEERGLTPQEFYGSSAAGGSAGSAGQQLGNNMAQREKEISQAQRDSRQRDMDREVQLKQTQMTTDAQIKAAQIGAGASVESSEISAKANRYTADLNKIIKDNQLTWDKSQFNQVILPAAAAVLEKTIQETNHILNVISTSAPKFVKAMKLLSMGPENMAASMIANSAGVDITDIKQLQAMPEKKRENLLAAMIGAGGNTRKEIEGVIALIKGMLSMGEPDSNPSHPDNPDNLGNNKSKTITKNPFFSIKKYN